LTHNRIDFEGLAKEYYAFNKKHCGIIIAADNSPQEVVRRLITILNDLTADEIVNQVVYI